MYYELDVCLYLS